MEILSLKSWFKGFDNYPFIVAGPCSAESEEQVMSVAAFLQTTGKVNLLRAGIWKPRTRPGTFSGSGIKALKWLQMERWLEILSIPVLNMASYSTWNLHLLKEL